MYIAGWFPLGLTGWISLQSKGLSRVLSNTTVQKHQFFGAQLSSWSNSHICTWLLDKPVVSAPAQRTQKPGFIPSSKASCPSGTFCICIIQHTGHVWLLDTWNARSCDQGAELFIFKFQVLLVHLNFRRATWYSYWKRPWCWERLKAGREGDNRGQDGWMASMTRWTWVWASSRNWW